LQGDCFGNLIKQTKLKQIHRMKKLILLFITSVFFMACDPAQNIWIWAIENTTDQVLKFQYPGYAVNENGANADSYYHTKMILPGDVIFIKTTKTKTGTQYGQYFDDYFKTFVSLHGNDIYWQIMSENGVPLKTWKYSEKDLPNQRFFDESEWHYSHKPGEDAFITTEYSWVFEIMSEDIEPTN
jgi:hypothetical protein